MGSLKPVTDNGYCVGCGACACVPDSPIRIRLNEYGQFAAVIPDTIAPESGRSLAAVCPFSDSSQNEDEIAKALYSDSCSHDARIGYHRELYVGYVSDASYRKDGSSGGITSWLLSDLLARGYVDGIIHVVSRRSADDHGLLFEYGISRSEADVRANSKSRYYPIELSQVLQTVSSTPGRYAFVGVPCFVKALRLLQKHSDVLRERVVFTVSLFCGHLKSTGYAAAFGWQMGVRPSELTNIDFRAKTPGKPASIYTVVVEGAVGGRPFRKVASADELYGSDWGLGFFKYKACDYCDDVAGETADIAIGDAWLPEYSNDWRGHNIIVCRSVALGHLLQEAASDGKICLTPVPANDIVRSQDGAYRHKRAFLGYRLWKARASGSWHPPKRYANRQSRYPRFVQRQQDLRTKISEESHKAFLRAIAVGDLTVFKSRLAPLVDEYRSLSNPLWLRLIRSVWRFLKPAMASVTNQSVLTRIRWAAADVLLRTTGRRA